MAKREHGFVSFGWCCAVAFGGLVACGGESDGQPTGVIQSEQIVPPSAATAPAIGPTLPPGPGKRIGVTDVAGLRDAMRKGNASAAKRFTIPSDTKIVTVTITEYRETDNRIAMTGKIEGSEGSEASFIASDETVTGWISDPGRREIYAYQSEAGGTLRVETIPLE